MAFVKAMETFFYILTSEVAQIRVTSFHLLVSSTHCNHDVVNQRSQ